MLYFVIWCYVFARCVIFCYIHPYRTAASAICLPTHRPPASMAAILGREPKDLSTKEPKHRHENMAGPRQTCISKQETLLVCYLVWADLVYRVGFETIPRYGSQLWFYLLLRFIVGICNILPTNETWVPEERRRFQQKQCLDIQHQNVYHKIRPRAP